MEGRILRLSTAEMSRPRSPVTRWFLSGGPLDRQRSEDNSHPWHRVLWLTGVDYFSSLAYQAGIALIAAGALAPVATLVLVVVTLVGALPVYAQVAGRSYAGQGSIAMLESFFSGWKSKIVVLLLLGFAATDFVITMTLSAADAARHATANAYFHPYLHDANLSVTLILLLTLTVIFLIGFRQAIRVATFVAIPFLLLNLMVLVAGCVKIAFHPDLVSSWRLSLTGQTDWIGVAIASAIIFPKLALGLSGFETGVAVMPMVSGGPEDKKGEAPVGRIRNTRKLLTAAALIMGVLLLLSSFVTTLLIPASAYRPGGPASGRALAYLAHELLGNVLGTVYDVSTILILWFAGASAMAGLISLIPRYLPRFGMAPRWVSYRRPMVITLFVIDLIVTLIFRADVEAQGSAYATGVLVLILSAAVAAAIALWHDFLGDWRHHATALPLSLFFWLVSLLFFYTVIVNIIERPAGAIISAIFIFAILFFSGISRYQRSQELRISDTVFGDSDSAQIWPLLVGRKVNLVPHGLADHKRKAEQIYRHYQVSGPLAFLHVNLRDNRSEFMTALRVSVSRERQNFIIQVSGAVATANTIAYISELIDPLTVFLELTEQNLMLQSLRYLFWGEGEVGLTVYSILVRYWEWSSQETRPTLYLMSLETHSPPTH